MSKALQGNNEIFDDVINMAFHDVIYILCSLSGRKMVENWNFFVFHPICLNIGIGGNFEILITKRKPKLTLDNDLSKNCNFLPILEKITPSTLQ